MCSSDLVTVVAPLARIPMTHDGAVIARWSDGEPAASERTLGAGCLRRVSIGVPRQGDLMLQDGFRALEAALRRPCGATTTALAERVIRPLARAQSVAVVTPPALAANREFTAILLMLAGLALAAEQLLRRRTERIA